MHAAKLLFVLLDFMKKLIAAAVIILTISGLLSIPSCQCNSTPKYDSTKVANWDDGMIKKLTLALADKPTDPELYYQRAQQYYSLNNLKASATDLQSAIHIDSTNTKYYFTLADVFLASGTVDGCLLTLKHILLIDPENKDAKMKMAKAYIYIPDFAQALALTNEIIKADGNNAEAYFLQGIALKGGGDTTKAIQSFMMAVQKKPDFYDAYMQLGLLHSEKHNSIAPQYFDNAIQIDSSVNEAWYAKGKFYHDLGDNALQQNQTAKADQQYEQAKKIYKHLIVKDPQYQDAYFNLGTIYYNQDSLDMALRMFNLAIQMAPTYAEAYYGRGLVHEVNGETDEAASDFRQALNLQPDYEKAQKELDKISVVN